MAVREGHAVRRAARRAAARSPTAGSTRSCRASCSSGTRWCEGEWQTHHEFFHDNRDAARGRRGARAPGPAARHPGRRRDAVRRSTTSGCRPTSCRRGTSTRGGRRRGATTPDLLTFDRGDAGARRGATRSASGDYPDAWRQGDLELPLTYQFEPGTDADGVTVHVPLSVLNQVTADGFDWQVPGLRLELVTALIRSLPKALRRSFVPGARHRARRRCAAIGPDRRPEPFTDALARELRATDRRDRAARRLGPGQGARPPAADVPGRGRRRRRRSPRARTWRRCRTSSRRRCGRPSRPPPPTSSATGLTSLVVRRRCPPTFAREVGGRTVRASPRWSTRARRSRSGCSARRAEADRATHAGVRRLLALTLPSPLKGVVGRLDNPTKLALGHNPHGSVPALLDDCVTAALDALMARTAGRRRRRRLRPAAGAARARAAGHDVRRGAWRSRGSSPRRTTCRRGCRGPQPRPCCRPGSTSAAGLAAGAPGLRHRHRRRPAARPAALPDRGAAPARRARPPRAGTPSGWPGCRWSSRSTRLAGRAAAGPAQRTGGAGGALDARGAAGQPVRPAARHAGTGLGAAHLPRHGRGRQ